jgi:hypothetical protein
MFFLLLLALAIVVNATNVPTDCSDQLWNYYVALGMPMATPMQQTLVFTQGSNVLGPFVQVEILIQQVARAYANLLPNNTLANFTFVADVSLDCPWCISLATFQCCDNATIGTAKTTNCTQISDFDPGGSNPVAGRFFIYSNQTASCAGTPIVTFYNVSLSNGSVTGTWTYDAIGIEDHVELTYDEALFFYRISPCNYSNGDPADLAGQYIFVCTAPAIVCNGTRSGGTAGLTALPAPAFACFGKASDSAPQETVIWRVSSFQPNYGVEGYFGITYTTSLAFAASLELAYANTFGAPYALLPSTFRQFDSQIPTVEQFALIYYNGQWATYQPQYPFSNDPKISLVPCRCTFSVTCLPGPGNVIDTTSTAAHILSLNNTLPVCNPGPPIMVPLGEATITLNASLSFDPDSEPAPFNVLWEVDSTPYDPDPPPFNITCDQSLVCVVDISQAEEGNYTFLLYASDLQDQVPCLWLVEIVGNQVFAVTQQPSTVFFTFYAGDQVNHSCSMVPQDPSIEVLGNYTYATVPNTTIFYSWIQTSGPSLAFRCDPFGFFSTADMFNTDKPIMNFVPPTVAQYCFQLTAWAVNVSNSTALVCITVQPNFQQPESNTTIIPNYTAPPIINLTPPTRPIITFPNQSFPPLSPLPPVPAPPEGNITPPPPFPVFPPPTPWEWFLIFLGLLLFGAVPYVVMMAMSVANADTTQTRYLVTKTYGGQPY